MNNIALSKLRQGMQKEAAVFGSEPFAPGYGGIGGSGGGGLLNFFKQRSLARQFPRLALYQQTQALKNQQALKNLSKYKSFGGIAGGALGMLALLAMSGNLGGLLGGSRRPEVQAPTMVRYG